MGLRAGWRSRRRDGEERVRREEAIIGGGGKRAAEAERRRDGEGRRPARVVEAMELSVAGDGEPRATARFIWPFAIWHTSRFNWFDQIKIR